MRSHTLLGRLALVPLLTLLLSLLTTAAPAARAAAADPVMGPAGGRSALRRAGVSPAHLPAGLAPVLQRTLRQAAPRWYALRRAGADYVAANPVQGLHVVFTAAGPRLTGLGPRARWTWGLTLVGIGRGRLHAVRAGQRMARGAWLAYRRGSLTEWYRNSPQGLEQGMTLQARPAGAGTRPVVLALRMAGTVRARLGQRGQTLALVTPSGATVGRYSGLQARDATGRRLGVRLALHGATLHLVLDDQRARYPVRIDPVVQQVELGAADGASLAYFGWSVALSSDGSTALIGAYGTNNSTGAAYVFTRSGSSWSPQQELTAGDGVSGDAFGIAVALSADGTTALVGARGANNYTGAAYVFTRSGSSWSPQQKLTASDGAASHLFGWSVALSSDGSTALIGAYGTNNSTGAAYVFTRSGSSWSPQQELTAGDGVSGDAFGSAVALSSDGSMALIGAYGANTSSGAAYVFVRSGSSWSPQQKLSAADGVSGDNFGYAVALSSDGSVAFVGAYAKNNFSGAAYVFVRSGTTWSPQQELSASTGGSFGDALAVSGDGSMALIAADTTIGGTGAAYVFTRSGSSWSQQQELNAADRVSGDNFGFAVALSGDASTTLAGAPFRTSATGTTYVFSTTTTSPPTLFSNSFDSQSTGALVTGSGPNQFTGVVGGDRLTVQSTITASPPNALAVTVSGGGSASASTQYSQSFIHHDLSMHLQLGSDVALGSSDYLELAQTTSSVTSNVGKVNIILTPSRRIRLDYFDSAGTQHYLWGNGYVFPTGSWHTVELRETVGAGSGSLMLVVDGTVVVLSTNLDTGSQGLTRFVVGDVYSPSDTAITGHLYVDDVTTTTW